MGKGKFLEVYGIVKEWEQTVHSVLKGSMRNQKPSVGDTGELERSLKTDIVVQGDGFISIELRMRARGRFVDMGVGRGVDISEANNYTERAKSRGAKRKRKPKKWYSVAFFARLNTLQGMLGYKAMGDIQEIVHNAIDTNYR